MKPTVATVGMATGRVRDGLGWNGPPPTPKLSTGPRPRVDIRVEIIPRPRPLRSPLRVSLDVRLRDALSLCAAPVRRRHASATLRRRRAAAGAVPPRLCTAGREGKGGDRTVERATGEEGRAAAVLLPPAGEGRTRTTLLPC